ncbi:MAG: class I SAM-dependent methyltransferase [Candidatus Eiseniibacteriota bacterium]
MNTPDPTSADPGPTTRFSNRASDYVRFRPDYPLEAIDVLLAGLEPCARGGGEGPQGASVRAADVGAGTGISARALAERGVEVIAIEPNAAMRNAAAPHPLVTWREGTAEATGLEPASVDLVVCAQAFHWFRQAEAVTEFHRVLRERGRLGILWNRRDRSDPLTRDYVEAIHAVHGEHAAERMEFDPNVLNAAGEFSAPVRHEFPHAQRLDRAGLLGRAKSASYVPKEGPACEFLTQSLFDLHAQHQEPDGNVTLRYRTEVWITTRLPLDPGHGAPARRRPETRPAGE